LNTVNDAIGARLLVPKLDANNWPQGGVRTPDEAFPIGSPTVVYPNGAANGPPYNGGTNF
jgi:hypothetical protein